MMSSATGTTSVSTTKPTTTTAKTTTKIASTSTPPKTTTVITTTTVKTTTTSLVTTTKTTTSSLYTTSLSINATASKTSTSRPTTTYRANPTTAIQAQTITVSTNVYSSTYTSTPIKTSATPSNVTATQPGETESLNPSLNSTIQSSAQRGLSSQDKLAMGLSVAFVIAIIITIIVGILIWRSRRKRQSSSSSVVKSSVAAPPSSVDRAKWPDDTYYDGEQGKYVNFKTRDTEMYTSIHLNSTVDQNDNSNYLNTIAVTKSAIPDTTHAELASSNYEEEGFTPQYANEHDKEPHNTHVYLVLKEEADNNEIASARNAPHLAKNRKRSHDEIYSLANDATFSGNAIPSRTFRNNEIQDEVSGGETAERNLYSQGGIGAASHGPKHNSGNQDSCDVLPGNGSSANIYFELENVVNGGSEDAMVVEYMNIDEDMKHYSKLGDVVTVPAHVYDTLT